MNQGIKALIEKEKDAKEQLEKAIAYREQLKLKSNEDANIAISMIIENQNHILALKKEESKEYLKKYRLEKDKEFEKAKDVLIKKDFSQIIEKLADIISGKNNTFD